MAIAKDENDTVDVLAATRLQAVLDVTEIVPASRAPDAELIDGQSLAGGRFTIVRRLGQGGMGRVYEAYDEAYATSVALKTLRAAETTLLVGLKNEFRSLSGILHPNLVELYELHCDDGLWFMTMELVRGRDLAAWLVKRDARDPGYEQELRGVLREVARGVAALHAAGKLHRDLKPSNVMLADDGRVVILDFGLVKDAAALAPDERGIILGTPPYMAPEQATGEAATAASDWYAFGVLMFQALTGRLPFADTSVNVLVEKLMKGAPPLEALTPHAATDLRLLCNGLLERNPARRAQAPAVLATLIGADDTAPPTSIAARGSLLPLHLFGRDAELAELERSLARAASGHVEGVWVHGPSGIGKSSLVAQFLEGLERDARVLVLRGRCYERESVPYKAFDAVMDRLGQHLSTWAEADRPEPSAESLGALLRLFPTLERVPWSLDPAPASKAPTDQQELRRLGFVSLRELLHLIAEKRTVVIHIDDMQWGDLDSARLLSTLLVGPAPRRGLLLLGSFRSDERESGELLPNLSSDEELGRTFVPQEIALGPLPEADAVRMASRVLGDDPELAREVVREADGSPFFIGELARHVGAEARRPRALGRSFALSKVIEDRVARLPAEAQSVLGIVAASGRPIESRIALLASELRATDKRVVARLEAARLVRARRTEGGDLLETYHDRVRAAVVASLGIDELRRVHRSIAVTLEENGAGDPERLALHFREADDARATAKYAALAGNDAFRALAFERAAAWYEMALARVASADEERSLRRRLGDALTYAGRGAQAARHYLQVARTAERSEAIELERRAAEQLLISGHRADGLATLTSALEASGVPGPNRGLPIARLLFERARLRARGTSFTPKQPAHIDANVLRRVDACGVAARTLIVREPVEGAIFGTMHLRLALDSGEVSRIVEGLATEITYSATEGIRAVPRVERLIECASKIELTKKEPTAQAHLTTSLAAYALLTGRFAEAARRAGAAEALYRERCTGVTGPLNLARCIWAPAMLFMGDIPATLEPLARWLESAREREDLEAEGQLGIYRLYGALAGDDVAAVREGLEPTLARWRPGNRETAGMTAIHVLAVLECYLRASPEVLAAVRELYQPFFRSLMARVQLYRVVVMGYCANLDLAMAAQGHQRRACLRRAESIAERLEREKVRYADALAHLARAGVAHLRGDLDRAASRLGHACSGFEADRQMLWASCARLRLGRILGGDTGTALSASAAIDLRERGVKSPERFAAVYAPGYPD